MDSETLLEVILPRRVAKQPAPFMHPGGDCGPCCIGGVIGTLVPEVYAILGKDAAKDSFSYVEMRDALGRLEWEGYLDRLIDDLPIWPHGEVTSNSWYGLPAWDTFDAWYRYVRMALDAGYYGIACVVHKKVGPLETPDHWVLICGVREREERIVREGKDFGARIETEILISNSSTQAPAISEEWVNPREFLMKWGGYNLLLCRPHPKAPTKA